MDKLVNVASSWSGPTSTSLDAKFVDDQILSAEDLATFLRICNEHSAFGDHVMNLFSWELLDKLHSFSISSVCLPVDLSNQIVDRVFSSVRPREGCIMIAEKLFSTNDASTFFLLCNAMKITLSRSDDPGLWKEGKLRSLFDTCSPIKY